MSELAQSQGLPIVSDERQRLAQGAMQMEIDISAGARIVSFALDGLELLTPASVHPDNYGSTLWDAPQSAWNWPPRAALDSAPYQLSARSPHSLTARSAIDPCGLQFTKRFTLEAGRNAVAIDYTISHHGSVPMRLGPWEVTRVAGGLSFFPWEAVAGLPPSALEPVQYVDGLCWYHYDASLLEVGHKLFAGAREGWLAHVNPQRLLFVKCFPDTQPQDYAEEQGEVEIWGHDKGIYVELENHGACQTLAPGEALHYPVRWLLSRLPEEIEARVGNPALAAYARQLALG